MINAKEAVRITESSLTHVNEYLSTKIEPQVKAAARNGLREVMIHIGSTTKNGDHPMLISECEKMVVNGLNVLGYTASVKCYGKGYVPRGLSDDDGNGPLHFNYGISINW